MVALTQLILVLACLYFGARRGGVALGVISGIGAKPSMLVGVPELVTRTAIAES